MQSTSFARMDPYRFLLLLFNATRIIAGFLLKKTSKMSLDFFGMHVPPITFFVLLVLFKSFFPKL